MNQFEKLKKLHSNLKKSIHNTISDKTLQAKLDISTALYNEIEAFLKENCAILEETVFTNICKNSRLFNYEIQQIVNQKIAENKIQNNLNSSSRHSLKRVAKTTVLCSQLLLGTRRKNLHKSPHHHSKHKKRSNSTQPLTIAPNTAMAFNIATAAQLAQLIPAFDGKPSGSKSFIDAVELTKTIVAEANHASAIQLVLTKLTGRARDLFSVAPATLDEIIQKIKDNCSETGSCDLAAANLKNLKLKKTDDMVNFSKDVENLCENLAQAYIREQVPGDVAKKLAQKQAIQTLISNSHNSETKIMLKVGKFTTVQEALNVMVENEQTSQGSTASILHANVNERKNHRYPNNGRGYQQNYGYRTPNNRPTNFYGNRGRFTSRGRGFHRRGGFRNGQNQFYRNYGPNNSNNQLNGSSRVFYATEFPSQQHEQVRVISTGHVHQQADPLVAPQQIQPTAQRQHPLGVPFGQHTQ